MITANFKRGGKVSHISGGNSVPKISVVPFSSLRRSGMSLATSILSSLSLSNFTCLVVDDGGADAAVLAIAAVGGPPKDIVVILNLEI